MSQSVTQKDWIAVFKVTVMGGGGGGGHIIKCDFSCFWTVDPLATRLGMVIDY